MLFKINALLVFGGANIEFFSQLQFYFFVLCALDQSYLKMGKSDLFAPLLRWYSIHARQLPWRLSKNPYHVYISEVVFQQTRIEQGIGYYNRIIEKYPDINALAKASEDDFLNIWQGLGYYSRAHNLLKAARTIVEKYNSIIPSEIKDLESLPGVGSYTAAAIASIAFNKAVPVMDGNIKRVISRLKCIEYPSDSKLFSNEVLSLLNRYIVRYNPSDFNQALMETGALICKPRKPACVECSLRTNCCAYKSNRTDGFPLKGTELKRKTIYLHYVLVKKNKSEFYLVKRDHKGMWRGLYELPGIQSEASEASANEFIQAGFPGDAIPQIWKPVYSIRHELTHRTLEALVYQINYSGIVPDLWLLVDDKNIGNYPLHRLMQKFFVFAKLLKIK
ncbi:MAG: A/G-specific adenine glycosylase [Bacteroidetes bacterium HGW-Bacteroidetes-6]|jgi:A/G-specific adenine glycosylase|nr:MAG: A/G-specific adenine glycosylase [Bacteroidetes bacterium HGW-Bacteroidetes-6]